MLPAKTISILTLLLLLSIEAAPMHAQTPLYANDFQSGTTTGWSTLFVDPGFQGRIATTSPPNGGRFLGEFGNQTVRLDLPVPAPHDTIRVVFDLYVIQTWDGNITDESGQDVWSMGLAGAPPVVRTTFNNTGQATQAYPDSWPGGVNRFRSGAVSNNTLGYTNFGDAIYHFDLRIPHTGAALALEFTAALREAPPTARLSNESWGIDNISISTILAPVVIPAATIEAGVVSGAPGDIVEVPIRLRNARALERSGATSFSGILRFDASLLLPVDRMQLGTVSNGVRSIPLTLPTTTGPDSILTTIRFHAALGSALSTSLSLEGFSSTGGSVLLDTIAGRFALRDYCSAGGPRLVAMGSGGLIKVSPNPAPASLDVEFTLVEDGAVNISLYDPLGIHVSTLFDGIAPHGDHRQIHDAASLPAGDYLILLRTPHSTMTTRVTILH
jgi:hypothetical protein